MLQLSMQIVVAGLVWNAGKLLIAQRRRSDPHPLEWEFPGGKAEPGESAEEALVRELDEELGITAEIGALLTRYEYSYPAKDPITLIFFHVTRYRGVVQNRLGFESLRWETPAKLPDYQFLAGDLPLIQLLREIDVNQIE